MTVYLTRNLQVNLVGLSAFVNQQALVISYVDDFRLMMLVTLAAIPLALMLRKPKVLSAEGVPAADAD